MWRMAVGAVGAFVVAYPFGVVAALLSELFLSFVRRVVVSVGV